jgi:hypothetical protein
VPSPPARGLTARLGAALDQSSVLRSAIGVTQVLFQEGLTTHPMALPLAVGAKKTRDALTMPEPLPPTAPGGARSVPEARALPDEPTLFERAVKFLGPDTGVVHGGSAEAIAEFEEGSPAVRRVKQAKQLTDLQSARREISALEGELGALPRPDGGISTEISITSNDFRDPNRYVNIPLLVEGQVGVEDLLAGKQATLEQQRIAMERAKARVAGGATLPSFQTPEEAVAAAQARSRNKDLLIDMPPPKSGKAVLEEVGARQNLLERGLRDIEAGALHTGAGLAGFLAGYTGDEGYRQVQGALKTHAQDLMPADPKFLDELAAGFGSTVTFLIPGLGVMTGASAVARVAPRMALWLGSAASGGLEAAVEAGAVYDDLRERGFSHAEAVKRAEAAFWTNAALVTVTNRLGLFGERGGQLMRRSLSAVMEGGQEFSQQVISNVSEGKPDPFEGAGTSAAIGGIIGATLGGSTSGNSEAERRPSAEPEVVESAGRVLPGSPPRPIPERPFSYEGGIDYTPEPPPARGLHDAELELEPLQIAASDGLTYRPESERRQIVHGGRTPYALTIGRPSEKQIAEGIAKKASVVELAQARHSRESRMPKVIGEGGPQTFPDARLARETYRRGIEDLASQLVEGGGITLVGGDFTQPELSPDKQDPVRRTKSQNPQWFQRMVQDPELAVSVAQTKEAVRKALAGERLGVREARVVTALLYEITDQRIDPRNIEYARKELERAREFRRAAAKGLPPIETYEADFDRAGEIFEEQEYDPDWDGEARSLYELAHDASAIDPDAAEVALDSAAPDTEIAKRLYAIIARGQHEREQPQSAEKDQGKPAEEVPAEAPAAAAEAVTPPAQPNPEERPAAPVAESQAPATSEPGEGGTATARESVAPADVEAALKDRNIRKLLRDRNIHPESPVAWEWVKGYVDGQRGVAPDPKHRPKSTDGMRQDGFNPINAYLSAYLHGRGQPYKEIRELDAAEHAAWSDQVSAATDVDAAAAEAATSPRNDLPQPTPAQKEAGNYQKGHVSIHGFDISIENPKGSYRYKLHEERLTALAETPAPGSGPGYAAAREIIEKAKRVVAMLRAGDVKAAFTWLKSMQRDASQRVPAFGEILDEVLDGAWFSEMKAHYGYVRRTEGADGEHVDVFVGARPESQQVFVIDQVDPKTGKFDEHKVMLGYPDEAAARRGYLANYERGWKGLGKVTAMSIDEFRVWLRDGDTASPAAAADQGDLFAQSSATTPTTSGQPTAEPEAAADTAKGVPTPAETRRQEMTGSVFKELRGFDGLAELAAEKNTDEFEAALEGRLTGVLRRILRDAEESGVPMEIEAAKGLLWGNKPNVLVFDKDFYLALQKEGIKISERKRKSERDLADRKKGGAGMPRGPKMESTGERLRRLQDMFDQVGTPDKDTDALLDKLYDETKRADLMPDNLAVDASPGARRYLDAIRNNILPLSEYLGDRYGASRGRHGVSPKEAVSDRASSDWAKVMKDTVDYVEKVGRISDVFAGQRTIDEMHEALQAAIYIKKTTQRDTPAGFQEVATWIPATPLYNETRPLFRKDLSFYFVRSPEYAASASSKYPGIVNSLLRNEQEPDAGDGTVQPLRRPRLDHILRTGLQDRRNGKNVSAQDLKKAFGFADVTFGDYVTAEQRQEHVNYAFDAFHDLADALGIPSKGISLGGTLHLAFGALGQGRHAAHYSPNHPKANGGTARVINLTNTRGDGSLAHEWMHALDYHLRTWRGEVPSGPQQVVAYVMSELARPLGLYDIEAEFGPRIDAFLRGNSYWRGKKSEGPVANARYAINEMRSSIHGGRGWYKPSQTKFYAEANRLDGNPTRDKKRYWSKPEELFARTGEAWVYDVLSEKAARSDYLVSDWVADGKVGRPQYRGQPYPVADERTYFATLYRALFDNLEWAADGSVAVKLKPTLGAEAKREELLAWLNRAEADLEKRLADLKAQEAAEEEVRRLAKDEAERRAAEEKRKILEAELAKTAAEPEPPSISNELASMSDEDIDAMLDEIAAETDEAKQDQFAESMPAQGQDDPMYRTASSIADALLTGSGITKQQIISAAAEAFGGTMGEGAYSIKDAFDAMEAGVNMALLAAPSSVFNYRDIYSGDAAGAVERLDALINGLPTQSNRTDEQQAYQQFSTPHTHAYVAAWVANLSPADTVLEPSAGTGNLVVHAKNFGARVIANEIAARRFNLLRRIADEAYQENAEHLDNILPETVRPTVTLMNPPFSAAGERLAGRTDTRIGAQHVEQALARLAPGGRLVAILGRGMAMDRAAFKDWWAKIQKEYSVRANITVSGQEYRKFGTTFDNQFIVIDKTGPTSGAIITGTVEKVRDLIPRLEGVRNDRTPVREQPSGEPALQANAGAAPAGAGSGTPLLPADHGVGGEGEAGRGRGSEPGDDVRTVSDGGVRGTTGEDDGGAGIRRGRGHGQPGGTGRTGPAPDRDAAAPEAASGVSGRPDVHLTALAAEFAKHGVKGTQETLQGLAELFGGNRIKSFPAGFDEEAYAKAKPHFEAALREFEAAGKTLRELMQALIAALGDGIKPYLKVFAQEVRDRNDGTREARPQDGGEVLSVEIAPEVREKKELGDNVYEQYQPTVVVRGAKPHPSKLVESAVMADVRSPPVSYVPDLPADLIESGRLSDAQLEAIALAGQAHSSMLPAVKDEKPLRAGFAIGDGTGVGKGAEVAGIILDNMRRGRTKAVWVSKNNDLFVDAMRDWKWVGGDEKLLFELRKFKDDESIKNAAGVIFASYDIFGRSFSKVRRAEEEAAAKRAKVSPLAPESMLPKSKVTRSRIDQLVDWLGEDFDGALIFDEAHNMANAEPVAGGGLNKKQASSKALAGVEIQRRLPNARVVYVTATAAIEVRNLAYMDRLGLWGKGTPFATKQAFISNVDAGGVAAMELVAKDLKALGKYIARSLSYEDVSYGELLHELNDEQRAVYDELASAWQTTLRDIATAMGSKDDALGGGQPTSTNVGADSRARAFIMQRYWSTHQRFFNQIITSMQMPSVIRHIEEQLAQDRVAVLQLVNTNEAQQERALAKLRDEGLDLDELDMTPRDALMDMVRRVFPIQQHELTIDEDGKVYVRPVFDSQGNPVQNKHAVAARDALLEKLGALRVPEGPLEILFNHFGPDRVAEMTGRKRRVVRDRKSGKAKEQQLSDAKMLADVDAFLDDRKQVLVFSDKGGTGKSYHADRNVKNQKKRVHYLIQPGWRADNAVQGFGRTHRSNYVTAPHYVLVTTDLKAQRRFLSSVARRLDQLGALTKGQRQTGGQGIFSAEYNLETPLAHGAILEMLKAVANEEISGVTTEDVTEQMGLNVYRSSSSTGKMELMESVEIPVTRFLNRMLSLRIDTMNRVFDAFWTKLNDAVEAARADGTLDAGVSNLTAQSVSVDTEQVVYTHPDSGAETKYLKFRLKDPVRFNQFSQVLELGLGRPADFKGFYQNERSGHVYAMFKAPNKTDPETGRVVARFRRIGISGHDFVATENVTGRGSNYKELEVAIAREAWDKAIAEAPQFREWDEHLIAGAVLPVWDRLKGKPRVFRVQADDGRRFVGRRIDKQDLHETLERLGASAAAPAYSPTDALAALLQRDETLVLPNGWKLEKRRVSGENRIELVGPGNFEIGLLKQLGVFTEIINYRTRMFVPTGTDAESVLGRILADHPVVRSLDHGEADTPRWSLADETGAPTAGTTMRWQDFRKYLSKLPLLDTFGRLSEQELAHIAAAGETWTLKAVDPETLAPTNGTPSDEHPIIVAADGDILDGRRRAAAAVRRGDRAILAWVASEGGRWSAKSALYSDSTEGGMTVAEVERAIASAMLGVHKDVGLNVRVLGADWRDHIPDHVVDTIPAGKFPQGLVLDGTVYLFSPHIKTAREAHVTFAHDVVGHVGAETVIGSDWDTEVRHFHWLKAKRLPEVDDILDEVHRRYGGLLRHADGTIDENLEFSEFLAVAQERRVKEGPVARLLRRIRELLRAALRRLGFNRYLAEADIDIILSASENYLRTGRSERTSGGRAVRARELFALRIHDGERKTPQDFVVPESEEYAGDETGDLAYMPMATGLEPLPIRLNVGDVRKRFGIEKIATRMDQNPAREAPVLTADRAENIVREVARIARSFNEVYKEGDQYILRDSKTERAIVVELKQRRGEDYYAVNSLRPAENIVWGKPVWVGRGELRPIRLRQPGAPGLSPDDETAASDRRSLGKQTSKYILGGTRPEIKYKKGLGQDGKFSLSDEPPRYEGGLDFEPQPEFRRTVATAETEVVDDIKPAAEDAKQSLRQRANAIVQKLDERLHPLYGLADRTEYLKERYLTLGRIGRAQEAARKVFDIFHAASKEESAEIYAFLTDTESDGAAIIDEKLRRDARRVKRLVETVGAALVDHGVIPLESFERYQGRYLPRVYLAYLLGDRAVAALGTGKTISAMGYAKKRNEKLPQEYRDLVLGEIKDPAFLASRAIGIPLRDLAIMDWLSQIAENPNWVLPKQMLQWTMPGFKRPRWVTPYWLKNEASRLRQRADYYQDQKLRRDAIGLAAEMDETADKKLAEIGVSGDDVPAGYARIPNATSYGAVRGLIVRQQIYDDLVSAARVMGDSAGLAERILGYGGIGTKVTQLWKWSKVAASPPAQVRNLVSNWVLLHLSGVPLHRIPGLVQRAAQEIRTRGRYYRVGIKYGITVSTFAANEMLRIERETTKTLKKAKDGFSLLDLKDLAEAVIEWTGDRYQDAEMLSKLMKIMYEMETNGRTEAEAALEAQEWLFDYSLVGQNVRYLRNAPIGAPFLTFYIKVLPRLLETAVNRPERFLPYIALIWGSYLLAGAMAGVDGDYMKKLRKALPDFIQEKGHSLVLPVRDEHGRWQFVDIGYFLPWTMWTELVRHVGGSIAGLARGNGFGQFGELLTMSGLLGGPIPDLIAALMTGKDSFTGKAIVDETMPASEQLMSMLTYLYGMAMPSWLVGIPPFHDYSTYRGASGHLYEAVTKSVDRFGEPRSTVPQALARFVGVNVYPVEPAAAREKNVAIRDWKIREVERQLRRVARDRSLSDGERDRLIRKYLGKIDGMTKELDEYIEASELPPELLEAPPSERPVLH